MMGNWRTIDNTGKIFPATSNRRDTRVFRLYVVLKENVDGDVLQQALDKTIEKYPLFLSVIRKGFFWYYLEKSDLKPEAALESKSPCSSIYIRDKKSLLFEVTYYKNKINFEVFHALTDGTGAVEFIRELTKNYICIKHGLADVVLGDELNTEVDYETDGFDKYYENNQKVSNQKQPRTYQLHGLHCEPGTMKLNEYVFSTDELRNKARQLGVSITVLLTSVLIYSINEERRVRNKRPIGIMVPVNLRKYFPSETMMNFFGWISPYHDFSTEGTDLKDVVSSIKQRFKEGLHKENIIARMNKLVKMEKNPFLRGIPLELKIISMRLAASMSTGEITAVYSNIGALKLPDEIGGYVQRFGFFVSTPKVQMCSCSYKDEFTVSITSAFENDNIQRNFLRNLKTMGIDAKDSKTEYPKEFAKPYKGLMFVKVFTFAMIALAVITLGINYMLRPVNHWPLYTVFGAMCMWFVSILGYFKRKNLYKNAIWQQIIVTAICIIWDMMTGWKGWSVEFVFPAVNMVILISLFVISLVQKEHIRKNMIYFLMSGAIGLVPFVLLLTGCLLFPYVAMMGSIISFLVITAVIIFMWNDVKHEIMKKFHV
ncbi:MAG: DUF6320 domain-containing protein [Eubacteriales bacterium]|nr:DUF6320 domain-containing protein [Eubacteriales bacterium]